MHILYASGLWGCTVIAAHSCKHTNPAYRRLHHLAGVALHARKGNPRHHLGLTGQRVHGDNFSPEVQARRSAWVHRPQLLRGNDPCSGGSSKQFCSLSSCPRGGGSSDGGWILRKTREICLDVSGLRCGSCVSKLERALLSVPGVVEASVNLSTSQARVLTAVDTSRGESSTSVQSERKDIINAAVSVGFPATVLWQETIGGDTTVVLDIQGLKCGGCVSRGEEALMAVKGVKGASVNLAAGTATVTLAGNAPVLEEGSIEGALVAALSARGFPSKVLRVGTGESIDRTGTTGKVGRITPAERHEREATESRRRLRWSLVFLSLSATAHLGHHAHHLLPSFAHLGSGIGQALQVLPTGWVDWLQAGVATVALAGPGLSLIRSGMYKIRRFSPDMDSLVATGVLAVYVSSMVALLKPSLGLTATFHEPVMLLGAVLLGRSLEARQRLKAARGLQGLFDVRPHQARRVDSAGRVSAVPTGSVLVGDTVEVLPSDRFPVDGLVTSGSTAVDESSLTGEPMPVPKVPGDTVRAGTLSVGDGAAVRVKATATGERSVLASVIALVEDAQARKVPVQRLADKIAGIMTWLVLAASATTLLFWGALSPMLLTAPAWESSPLLAEVLGPGRGSEAAWVLGARLAVDVCLVACPCSLGLATPTAIMVGTGVAAERGLLLTGADVLETTRKVTTVVFDKTGTLTTGKPTVTSVVSLRQGWATERILEVAAAVERGCRHPLADAVVSEAEARLPEGVLLNAEDLRTVPGMGACAKVYLDGVAGKQTEIHVGSPKYIKQACPLCTAPDVITQRLVFADDAAAVDIDEQGDGLSRGVSERLSRGETTVAVAVDGNLVGLLFLADTVRPAAPKAIAGLSKRGLNVMVSSGDRREAVWAAAAAVGISRDNTRGESTPADKATLVRSLKARGDTVMVVGDGVNDAPALAAADVGVAMRGGTGSAMDAAGIILMRDDVGGVEQAIDVSNLTMRKVRMNLLWALGYNMVAIPVAAGVFLPWWGVMLSPALAGAIMSCSSVAVVTNSLLLRKALELKMGPVSS